MKFCLKCGEELSPKANFCPNCGIELDKSKQAASLTRAELYSNRTSTEASETETEFIEDDKNKIEAQRQTRLTSKSEGDKLEQFKNFVHWLKLNPLVALLPLVVTLAVFLWINKIMGAVLLILVIGCGYFYVLKVGSDDNRAELKLRRGLKKIKDWILKSSRSSKKNVPIQGAGTGPTKEGNFQDESQELVEEMPQEKASELVKTKKRHSWKSKLLILSVVLLLITTYIGPFASAIVAGYSTPTTLMNLLKTLGNETMLLVLIAGPVVILLGAWWNSKWIVKIGSWINLVAYGYTFYIIYENEAETSGLSNAFNNVHLGWSGYLAVAITIIMLMLEVKRKKRD